MSPSLTRIAAPFSVLALILALAACGSSEDGAQAAAAESAPRMETIRGTLNYEKDITLAPESIVTVELVELPASQDDATVIAKTIFQMPGKPPLPYSLRYDANKIRGGREYGLRAKIMEQKRLMFISTTDYPVLDEGTRGTVDIMLQHVPGGHIDRMADNVRENNPMLSGHYRYYDGAGEFTDCADGISHPLARDSGIFALESEYRDVAPRYGDEVYVRLAGKYVTKPARDGRGKEDYLVVMQVEEMVAGVECP